VYALAFDPAGRLLAGTGKPWPCLCDHREDRFVDLLKASATQVTAFAEAPGGGLYVSTSNLGKVFLLGGSPESEGSYEAMYSTAKSSPAGGALNCAEPVRCSFCPYRASAIRSVQLCR